MASTLTKKNNTFWVLLVPLVPAVLPVPLVPLQSEGTKSDMRGTARGTATEIKKPHYFSMLRQRRTKGTAVTIKTDFSLCW